MRASNPDFWWIVAAGVASFVILAVTLKKIIFSMIQGGDSIDLVEAANDTRFRSRLPSPTSSPAPAPMSGECMSDDPRCLACGDPATECMPSIERSRGARDWLRELFAMPPRYRRVVRGELPSLCRSHAHVADAMVDEFLHNRVRGAFTAAYTKVAVEAAGFEKEFLQKQLTESLTEDQKRAAKRAGATVTRLLKTADGSGG
jgi:hypothetical protein